MRTIDNIKRDIPEPSRPFLLRDGLAVVSIGLPTWMRLLLDPILSERFHVPTLLLAVLPTAWYGGLRPALIAVVGSAFSVNYFLFPPRESFRVKDSAESFGWHSTLPPAVRARRGK